MVHDERIPLLYLAPWVDIGGSDKGTLDWFRFLPRERFRASLITTQPSSNRRLDEIRPYAEEVWDLPQLMSGGEFPSFILTFIHTRGIELVHTMNSRLGFELLPQIAHLPDAPRVVVQLHVEEPDHSGYVRYVTSRYGNLVDAFSVSSDSLAARLECYDVPAAKRCVIRTGVDAEREFSPEYVRRIDGLDPGYVHILCAIRLTAQKDPLLAVAVAEALRARGIRFRLHVLGEGDLQDAVRDRIEAASLGDQVLLHGAVRDIAGWYAACDIVLLTSEFEGVPYSAYEAMAMAKPIVAPDLPGLLEILSPETGVVVSPRDDPEAYAEQLALLAADPAWRRQLGDAARDRALAGYSLARMATEHAALYESLLGTRRRGDGWTRLAAPRPDLRFEIPALRTREPGKTPLVSVIVPCFNHGRYLAGCLRSISNQTYGPLETLVVDNGSTDLETIEAMSEIEANEQVTVLRIPVNRGPSAARNLAVEHARGRYVLPLDADNMLLPGAVEALVEQLSCAGERIGFIYPNYQFFGNRSEFYEPPSYNLHALLEANYCDTSSLIDREVFDRGFRYPEDVGLGYEDWDLVLTLAEHGIYGEASRSRTLLYRKHGFTRADLVESADVPFASVVGERHPELFDPLHRARLKGEWRPALTLIVLAAARDGTDVLENLVAAAERQTCADFEVVVCTEREIWPTTLGGRLRRIPRELAGDPAQALARGIEAARGRHLLASYASAGGLLDEPAAVEKLLRSMHGEPEVTGLALARAPGLIPSFCVLDEAAVRSARLDAVGWPALGHGAPPASLELPAARPLEALAAWLTVHHTVQWRQSPLYMRAPTTGSEGCGAVAIGAVRHLRGRDAQVRLSGRPQLPELPFGVAERVRRAAVWVPPQTRVLCRHLHHASGRLVFSNDLTPPLGCVQHHVLGSVRALPFPGTASLSSRHEDAHAKITLGPAAPLDAPGVLGFVEQAPMPMYEPLLLGRHRTTGDDVLLAGFADPLIAEVDHIRGIGYVESYPIQPRRPPFRPVPYGLAGLVRVLDSQARRHRYGVGDVPPGRLAGELGALMTEPTGDSDPLYIDDDGGVWGPGSPAAMHRGAAGVPGLLRSAARWTGAPLSWQGFSEPGPKLRACARRARDSARLLVKAPFRSPELRPPVPAGYVLRDAVAETVPLYAGVHPVTGDQLLSNHASEPRELGYADVVLLGHLVARAPVTGRLGAERLGIPWASRFGLAWEPR